MDRKRNKSPIVSEDKFIVPYCHQARGQVPSFGLQLKHKQLINLKHNPTFHVVAKTLFYHYYHLDGALLLLKEHVRQLGGVRFQSAVVSIIGEGDPKEIEDALLTISDNVSLLKNPEGTVNEFATLRHLQNFSRTAPDDDWIVYIHSKGITHPAGSIARKKGTMHIKALAALLKSAERSSYYDNYDVIGSEMNVANFFVFGPPVVSFSGNIWAAKSRYIKKLQSIGKNMCMTRWLRFDAEAWIGCVDEQAGGGRPAYFNALSFQNGHYAPLPEGYSVEKHLAALQQLEPSKETFDIHKKCMDSCIREKLEVADFICNQGRFLLRLRRFVRRILTREILPRSIRYFNIASAILYRSGVLRNRLDLRPFPFASSIDMFKYLVEFDADKADLEAKQ